MPRFRQNFWDRNPRKCRMVQLSTVRIMKALFLSNYGVISQCQDLRILDLRKRADHGESGAACRKSIVIRHLYSIIMTLDIMLVYNQHNTRLLRQA